MAGFNYPRARATAERLIKRAGQTATLVKPGTRTGDPWNPAVGASTNHSCKLVVLDYELAERRNTEIQTNDRKVLMSTEGLNVVPGNSDQIIVSGKTYAVVQVKPLDPGGITLLYEIQARG